MESLIRGGHEEPVQSQHADEIKALRSKIQHSINNDVQIRRTDDDFFLLFLRACDFNVNASFELWCNYNQFRARNCDIYENLSAWQLHHVIEDGCPCVLPYSNQNGAKFMVIFAGCWDTESYGKADILTALILSMERLIEDSEAQRSGIIVITDFSGWTASHASQLSVSFIRQICCMFQNHYPARFLGLHFVNEPWYIKAGLNVLKPFIEEKVWKRIHFHGNNLAALHDYCHPDNLPAEFGGNKPAVNREYWARLLLNSRREKGCYVHGENPLKCVEESSGHDREVLDIPHVINM